MTPETVKIRITVVTEVELGPDSIYGTVEDWQDYKDDAEMVFECLRDEVHEAANDFTKWTVEEIRAPAARPKDERFHPSNGSLCEKTLAMCSYSIRDHAYRAPARQEDATA